MTVYHPGTRRSRGGPSRYGDYTIDVGTGKIDCPPEAEDEIAAALAEKYDLDPDCPAIRGETVNTCEVVKSDGEVCGRDRPCPYHD